MWIMSGDGTSLVNAEHYDRIELVYKGDAWLISAFTQDGSPKTLGKFVTKTEALRTMQELVSAYDRMSETFVMPENLYDRPMPKIMDARVKRRGGS